MSSKSKAASAVLAPAERALTPQETADFLQISLPALWRGVAAGRIPPPAYPRSRCPRWLPSWLYEGLERSRALPSEQKVARRAAKLSQAAA